MRRDLMILVTCGMLLYGCGGARTVTISSVPQSIDSSDSALPQESAGPQLTISWSPSTAIDTARYHIYACTPTEDCPARDKEPLLNVLVPNTRTTITRPFAVGTPFVLVITAEDDTGNESPPSKPLPLN